jgi:hypothetical protein
LRTIGCLPFEMGARVLSLFFVVIGGQYRNYENAQGLLDVDSEPKEDIYTELLQGRTKPAEIKDNNINAGYSKLLCGTECPTSTH